MSNWENSDPNTGPNPWTAFFGGGNPSLPPSQQTTGGAPLYGGGGGGGGGNQMAAAGGPAGGFDPQNLIFNPHDGHYSAFKRSIGPNGVYGYETVDVGDGSDWNAMAATLGVPYTTLQSMTEQARANAAQVQKGQYGSIRGVYKDGTVAYFDANGMLQRGSREQATAAGIPQTDIDRATAEMGQTQKTLTQMGQYTVVGMNPDHSLSVKDYSGNISSVSAADAAAGKIPGVTYSDFLRAFTEYGQGERTATKMGQYTVHSANPDGSLTVENFNGTLSTVTEAQVAAGQIPGVTVGDFNQAKAAFGQNQKTVTRMGQYTVVGMGASGVLTVEDFYGNRSEVTADHLPAGVSASDFQAAQSNYIQNQKTATESGTWTATTANPDGTITVRDYFGNTKSVSVDASGNVIDSATGQPFKGVSAGQVQQLVQQGVQRDWEGASAFGPQNQSYTATPAQGGGQPAAGSPQQAAGMAPGAAPPPTPAASALLTAPGTPSGLPGGGTALAPGSAMTGGAPGAGTPTGGALGGGDSAMTPTGGGGGGAAMAPGSAMTGGAAAGPVTPPGTPSALPGPSFPGVTPTGGGSAMAPGSAMGGGGAAPTGGGGALAPGSAMGGGGAASSGGGGQGGAMRPVPPVAPLPGTPTASGSPRTAPPSLTPAAQAQYAATPGAFDGAQQAAQHTGGAPGAGANPAAGPGPGPGTGTGTGTGTTVGAAQPLLAYGLNAGSVPGWTNQQVDLANQTFQNASRALQQSNIRSRSFAGGGWSAIGRPSIAGQQ